MKPTIQFSDFAKLEIRLGKVINATIPEGSKKLIRQEVDFGPDIGNRIIFSGILEWYQPQDLIGQTFPYLINLEPRPMMGEESQGMLLAAAPSDDQDNPTCTLLIPQTLVKPGTPII